MIPKCPKCDDTGVIDTGNNELPCDCPAGGKALFNVAGFAAPVRGADIDHLDRSRYCKVHQQYSCLICANGGIGHPIIEKEALDALQTEIGSWSDTTFPNSNRQTILRHIRDEVTELLAAQDDELPHEIADCIMLLLHLAHKQGISARDAIREKFEICKKRKWGPPDEHGVVRHIKEG